MPEEIQQNLVQDVPVENVTAQDPIKGNAVYKFMKDNKLTTLSEKDFITKYSTPEKAKEIHSFMTANRLTTLKDEDFYNKYLPGASSITVTDETGLKKKVPASSNPALQNLLNFAKSGAKVGKEPSAVDQTKFADKNQILAPKLVVPTNTREAVLANRQENWNSLVDDAAFRAVEKTVNKNNKQGVSYTRDKIQGMVDDYKKKVKSGELIIAEDPATGNNMLAIPDYNPLSSLLSTYNKGNEQKYEDAYFEGLSTEEKIKHKEVQQFVAQDDDSIPKLPAGIFGNLGGFGGQVINMLEKPIVYSIGLASGAGAAEAAALGTAELATAGGLSNVGNTLGFMSDLANSSYSPTWDKDYYGNLRGIENPTQQQKLEAANKATEAANYSKAIGGVEGLIFGIPFGSLSKTLEPTSKGFIENLVANGKNTLKHAPQMVGTSIVGQIAKGEVGAAYGSKETQADIVKEGLSTGYETAKFLASMSGLNAVKAAVPYAFTLLTNTKASPSKSLTAKAKAVIGKFPDEVIADIYNQAEQNGVIEPGKANEILNDIQKYREAEASVPETVTNTDARDAIAGKLEKLDKLDQELKATKVNARKVEIEKEKAQVEKEIDNIYNGDDVLANEKDNAGNPLKERSEIGKAPVLAEETVIKETPKAETKPAEEVKVTEEVKPAEVKASAVSDVKRIVEPSKPISEMNSEELGDFATETRRALKKQDKDFEGKTEKEKEDGGYYDVIDEVEDLRDASERINFIENAEDINDLANSVKSVLSNIKGKEPNEYQLAILNAAKNKAIELGIDPKDLIKNIGSKIASEYKDVEDAELMVKSALEKLMPKSTKEIKPTEVKEEVKPTEIKGGTPQVKPISEFKVGDKFVFATDRGGDEHTIVSIDKNGIVEYKSKGSNETSSASEIQRLGNDLALLKSDWDKGIRPNESEFEGSRFKSKVKPTKEQIGNLTKELLKVDYADADPKENPESAEDFYQEIAKKYLENDIDIVKTVDYFLGKDNVGKIIGKQEARAEVTKDDLKSAEAKFATAKDKFEKAKAKLEASQVTQKGLFGGEQKGMFAAKAEEAKSILDPLRKATKEAKTELDNIKNRIKVQEEAQQELKPVEKVVFKSSQGHTVELKNGELVVKDKKGEALSGRASRKAIEEYAENFDYSKGEKAPEVPSEITNSRDAAKYVVEESNNPIEIAEIYASEDLLPKESNPKFQAIAEYGLGRIKTSSYKNLGDPNKIEKSMYLKIFSEERGTPIDVLAKSISDKYEGLNVEPKDIVDYIEKYSKGDKGALEFKESDIALQAADKFNKLTGLELNSDLANKVIDNKLGKANKDQLDIIKQDYETAKQLEDAYWAEYEKTDGFTKESNISEIDKSKAAKEPEKKLEEAYKDLTNIEKRQIINSKFEELLKELKIEKICPTD